jgi:flavin reductase (DIM6/NTAB) family NADH-FMN oxidoreductase RutF
VLKAAFAAYECRVAGHYPYGDHDLFVAEVVAVQWERSAFTDDGRLDLESVSPVSYMGEDRYVTAAQEVYLDRGALVGEALEIARRR